MLTTKTDDAQTIYNAPTITIELIRKPNGNGFETVSYKVTAEGSRDLAIREIDDAVRDIESAYGKINVRRNR